MKKTILTILLVCLASAVYAQRIGFQMGESTNKKAYNPTMIHIAEGMQEGQLLVVEPELKAISGPLTNPVKAVKVRLCDMEWNDTKSITLSDTKKCSIGETFRTGNHLHTIISKDIDKKLIVRHVAVDAQNLDIIEDKPLVDIPLQKNDETYVWSVSSPNGQYHGVVYAVWSKQDESRVVAMMFDREMKKLWERQLVYSDVHNVLVTDNGTVATIRLGMVEDDKSLTAFRLNMASAEGEKHGEYVLNADVSDLALLNCDGNKVLAVALEGKGGYGAIRIGTLGNRQYTGLWGLVFDLDENKIRVGNRHLFTDEEIRTFKNDGKGTEYSKHEIIFLRKVDDCSTPQGGAVLYQHAWHEETRNMKTGMTSNETVYSLGILLVQANMNGELTVSSIPQNNQNAGWPKVGADVFAHGDKVYVITNESKEETDQYTPDRPAKRSKSLLLANTALSIYWFSPDGKGAKQMLEKEQKALLTTPLFAGQNNRFYFLTTSSIAPHISTVTLPANQ